MKTEIINLILEKLETNTMEYQQYFQNSIEEIGTRHLIIDNLLPDELALQLYRQFPPFAQMRLMKNFRECKYTYKNLGKTPRLLKDITFAIQSTEVIAMIEKITGLKEQNADPTLYAGGLSLMNKGQFLNPHIDNSHDGELQRYRTLNLLYYLSPNWFEENGGNLELWKPNVKEHITIPSSFNRLVLMETHPRSWHSVSRVEVNKSRCCVSNYYFSPLSPTGEEYFNVTSFSARPEQRFRRLVARVDNFARKHIRKFKKKGLGKVDIYQ